jgi:hypothetical protein
MNKYFSMTAASLVFLAAAVAQAVPNQYQVVPDQVTTSFDSSYDFEFDVWTVTSHQQLAPSVAFPNITADFNADKQLVVEMLAPTGQQFVVTPPSWSGALSFYMHLESTDSTTWGAYYDGTFSDFHFEGPTYLPPSTSGAFSYASGSYFSAPANFGMSASATASGPFSFTKAVATFSAPPQMTEAFTDHPMYGWIDFSESNSGSYQADPGQWVTLAPVPEPSTLAMLSTTVIALIGFARRRRRQAA